MFNEDEILDIEEAQDLNVFKDLQIELEDNFLEIEEKVDMAQEAMKNQQKDKDKKNDEEANEEEDRLKPFNHLGVDTMINLHDHIKELVQQQEKEENNFHRNTVKKKKKTKKGGQKQSVMLMDFNEQSSMNSSSTHFLTKQ